MDATEHPISRRRPSAAFRAAVLGALALAFAADADEPPARPVEAFALRLDVRGVDLWVGVHDRRGRPVPTPGRDTGSAWRLAVWEDGQRQEIDAVFPAAEMPLTVAVVLDTSPTMTEGGAIGAAVRGLERFLDRALAAEDRAALFTFREALVERVPFGAGPRALRAGLREAGSGTTAASFAGTAVRDAVWAALDLLEPPSDAGHPGRRALLLVTDGRDNHSATSAAELAARAAHSRVRLYVLLVGRRQLGGEWSAIAAATGGRALRARHPQALAATLRTVGREWSEHWMVSYRSSHAGDGRCRTLAFEARRADRTLSVRSPSGYCPSP